MKGWIWAHAVTNRALKLATTTNASMKIPSTLKEKAVKNKTQSYFKNIIEI